MSRVSSRGKPKRKMSAKRAPDPLKTTASGLWKIATIVGGALLAVLGLATAWTGLDLWVPAGVHLVDDHIEHAVKPLAFKQDRQEISILNGRLETLKSSKQIAIDQQGRLEIQNQTTKDPIAIQLIAGQKRNVADTIKDIDAQITNVSTELKQVQDQAKK